MGVNDRKKRFEEAFPIQSVPRVRRLSAVVEDALDKIKNNTVTALDLSSQSIGDNGATAIALEMKTNVALESLDMPYNQIGPVGAKALADMLEVNRVLKRLNLQANQVGPTGTSYLAKALESNHVLEDFSLRENGLGNEGANALAVMLRNNDGLKQLMLGLNGIGGEGCESLAKALSFNAKLEFLHLYVNPIGEVGALALADAIANNVRLRRLRINQGGFGSDAAIKIVESLEANIFLEYLYLDNNGINLGIIKKLYAILTINKTLKGLAFFNDGLGVEESKVLADAMRAHPALEFLSLSCNPLGDVGLLKIVDAINEGALPKDIRLRDCGITSNEAQALLDVLEENYSLIDLRVDNNGGSCPANSIPLELMDKLDAVVARNQHYPQFFNNRIDIKKGKTVVLNSDMLQVTTPDGNDVILRVSNTTHGHFIDARARPITQFNQSQIDRGEIRYRHDGSEFEPSYRIAAINYNGTLSSPVHEGTVVFTVNNQFYLSDLNGQNGFEISDAGGLTSPAGDFNNDGIDDVIIGSGSAISNGVATGQCYVLFGDAGDWPAKVKVFTSTNQSVLIFNGISEGDKTGNSVANAGDVNGDGNNDLLIGAYFASPGGKTKAGRAYLVFGRSKPWPLTVDISDLISSSLAVSINGVASYDKLSHRISSAGDVNGDGFHDLLLGAHFASPAGQTAAGQAYLLFGHNGSWPNAIELANLQASKGTYINGISASEFTGFTVMTAGDINGDGMVDVIVGAHGVQGRTGRSYIIFGYKGAWPLSIELASLGQYGVVIEGIAAGDESGRSVAQVGDVNGDGFDDVLIGASYAAINGLKSGQGYLIFGGKNLPQTMRLSDLDGVIGVLINGPVAEAYAASRVAPAGDVNADGFNDLAISNSKPGGYILFGHDGAWPPVIELSTLREEAGVAFMSGRSVSIAGDLNHDGYDDIIVSHPVAYPNARSWIIFGGPEPFSANHISIESGATLVLSENNLAVAPLIDERIITIKNVTHGHFAFADETDDPITEFTQGLVKQGEVVFVHDGSDVAPDYVVSAERITRVFSDVKPQAGNINFSLSTTATTTASTTTTGIAVTNALVFMTNTLMSTINPQTTNQVSDTGGPDEVSDSTGLIVGMIMLLLVLFGVGMGVYGYRCRQRSVRAQLREADEDYEYMSPQKIDIMLNPMRQPAKGRGAAATAVGAGAGVVGGKSSDTSDLPALDDENYVVDNNDRGPGGHHRHAFFKSQHGRASNAGSDVADDAYVAPFYEQPNVDSQVSEARRQKGDYEDLDGSQDLYTSSQL